jgi:hypothetical protein
MFRKPIFRDKGKRCFLAQFLFPYGAVNSAPGGKGRDYPLLVVDFVWINVGQILVVELVHQICEVRRRRVGHKDRIA